MINIGSSYSILSSKELLNKVIPNYPIGKAHDCIFLESGFNDTFLIKGEQQDHILRVYRIGRKTLDDINFEVEVLLHLKAMNIGVSHPIQRSDGSYITPISTAEGVRYGIVTPFAKGKPFTYANLDEAHIYGESVAKIHNATENFSSTYQRQPLDDNYLINAPLVSIQDFSNISQEHTEYIRQLSSRLSKRLKEMKQSDLDYGFCHGDTHGWNAHISSRGVEFFDFDFCGYGLRAYELSVFRWSARLRDKENERWNEFISGYRSVKAIREADLELVPLFMAIRDIWLIGQHIQNTAVFGRNWMNESYFQKRIDFLKTLESEIFNQ